MDSYGIEDGGGSSIDAGRNRASLAATTSTTFYEEPAFPVASRGADGGNGRGNGDYYYYYGSGTIGASSRRSGTSHVRRLCGSASLDTLLVEKAEAVCRSDGVEFSRLKPIQRLFITHYRCHMCRMLPLYHIDLTHRKRVRCGCCGHLVSFNNSGKYGKYRKVIANLIFHSTTSAAAVAGATTTSATARVAVVTPGSRVARKSQQQHP